MVQSLDLSDPLLCQTRQGGGNGHGPPERVRLEIERPLLWQLLIDSLQLDNIL